MKDKLRELAEMVREAYRAGFIAACKWPAPVSQDVDSSAYIKEFNDWSFSVREKHAAILDADGDGMAVTDLMLAAIAYAGPLDDPGIGWMGHNASHPDMFRCERCRQEHSDATKIPHLSDCSALTLINAMRRVAANAELSRRGTRSA